MILMMNFCKMREDFNKIMLLPMINIKRRFRQKKLKKKIRPTKGIKVGHIFYFSDKYSNPMNCLIDDKDEKLQLKWILRNRCFQASRGNYRGKL